MQSIPTRHSCGMELKPHAPIIQWSFSVMDALVMFSTAAAGIVAYIVQCFLLTLFSLLKS